MRAPASESPVLIVTLVLWVAGDAASGAGSSSIWASAGALAITITGFSIGTNAEEPVAAKLAALGTRQKTTSDAKYTRRALGPHGRYSRKIGCNGRVP